jgi:Mce-associated membrane protein
VTPRPRKIAGRTGEPGASPEPAQQPAEQRDQPAAEPSAQPSAQPGERTGVPPAEDRAPRASMFAGEGLTRALVIGLAVLAVIAVLQGVWFVQHAVRGDDAGAKVPAGQIAVPAGRPVVLDQTDVDAAVDQAAKDAVVLVKRDYRTYDADVTKAVDLLTDRFSVSYKKTAADVKQQFLADKVNVDAKVVAQGVVRANSTQVQALLFLDQYVTKGVGKKRRVTYTPYKVLLTMIHTNTGWLVDGIDTK